MQLNCVILGIEKSVGSEQSVALQHAHGAELPLQELWWIPRMCARNGRL